MQTTEPLVVAVPLKGGTLRDVLSQLARKGWVRPELTECIVELMVRDKDRLRAQAAAGAHPGKAEVMALWFQHLESVDPLVREAAACLRVDLDGGREGRPARLVFDDLICSVGGLDVILKGVEHEFAPIWLRRHRCDMSLTAYDAFHVSLLDALDRPWVANWKEFSEHIVPRNTDVRVLGSLGLGDCLGHYILAPRERLAAFERLQNAPSRWSGEASDPKRGLLAGETILIDPQYQEIYDHILNRGAGEVRFRCTTADVEREALRTGSIACYIVRSGRTLKELERLHTVGEPLITSETIVAVNQERLEARPHLAELISSLAPNTERTEEMAWRYELARGLGALQLWPGAPSQDAGADPVSLPAD